MGNAAPSVSRVLELRLARPTWHQGSSEVESGLTGHLAPFNPDPRDHDIRTPLERNMRTSQMPAVPASPVFERALSEDPSSFLFLVAMPGAPSSILAPIVVRHSKAS